MQLHWSTMHALNELIAAFNYRGEQFEPHFHQTKIALATADQYETRLNYRFTAHLDTVLRICGTLHCTPKHYTAHTLYRLMLISFLLEETKRAVTKYNSFSFYNDCLSLQIHSETVSVDLILHVDTLVYWYGAVCPYDNNIT